MSNIKMIAVFLFPERIRKADALNNPSVPQLPFVSVAMLDPIFVNKVASFSNLNPLAAEKPL